MDYISIIIQGVIQGLTEFLPVSSSGHLSVAQHFMNVGENTLAFRNASGGFYSIFPYYLGNDKGIFPYNKGYIYRKVLVEEYERKQTYDVYDYNLNGYACSHILLQGLLYRL